MKERKGFSLIELVVAVVIFSFVAAALATISATAQRHMFQNYRGNILKTGVLVSMRDIQRNLTMATLLDVPDAGASGNSLAFAINVDHITRCYPISAADTPSWHFYCIAACSDPAVQCLYHHTAQIPPNPNAACTGLAPTAPLAPIWPLCGPGGGGTVTLMMEYASPNPVFFSRKAAETVMVKGVPLATPGVSEVDNVRVMLRTFWLAAGAGLASAQRDVDFSLDTVVKINRSR